MGEFIKVSDLERKIQAMIEHHQATMKNKEESDLKKQHQASIATLWAFRQEIRLGGIKKYASQEIMPANGTKH